MITVLHLDRVALSTDDVYGVVFGDSIKIATDLYNKGLYNKVAVVKSNQLYDALLFTKNVTGRAVKSWVRNTILHWVDDSKPLRSSAIGDIFVGPDCGCFLLTKLGFYCIDINMGELG
jgi:hypothetical protein